MKIKEVKIRTNFEYQTKCPKCNADFYTKTDPIIDRNMKCIHCGFSGTQAIHMYRSFKTATLICSLCQGELTSIGPDGVQDCIHMYCKNCGIKS